MHSTQNILLAWYGDDFTGSTDALEFLERSGARAMLFLDPPTEAQLQAYPIQAYGVAGMTRSLSPDQMEPVLRQAFTQMRATGPRHVHYKVCSTFDSAPQVGSIGKAIDLGAEIFDMPLVPVLGGMPALGRYCLFGHLFARMGIGSQGKIYRIDRHPSMMVHPVTPADESDLRIHLGKQTAKKIGLIDLLCLEAPVHTWRETLDPDHEVVLIDALYPHHLAAIGQWLDTLVREDQPTFTVGSSGIEMALGMHWNQQSLLTSRMPWPSPGPASPLLVVSGSCSPVTAGQIAWAKVHGFAEVVLEAPALCQHGQTSETETDRVIALLHKQQSVVVHTGSRETSALPAEILGTALGKIALHAAENTGLRRIVVAGGDTSSYAARAMQIDAVEMIAPLVPGAPLCRAFSAHHAIHGLEVNFKGGQVGDPTYFGLLASGERPTHQSTNQPTN